jgi:hypothetical protein
LAFGRCDRHTHLPRCALDWRLGRVYFLAFLNPFRGQPDPTLTARLASLCHRRWPSGGARPIYRSCRSGCVMDLMLLLDELLEQVKESRFAAVVDVLDVPQT